MASVMSSLYDALRAANVDEEMARRASEEVAQYDNRFSTFESRMVNLEGQINLLRWMLGFNLAISVAVLVRLFV